MEPIRVRRAFTLVELLVVLAIILALIAILLPAAASVRRSARVAADLGILRELQVAHIAYATDFNGCLADARLSHGGLNQGSDLSFVNTLQPYADHPLALRSPLDVSPHWPTDVGGEGVPVPGSDGAFRRTSYGLNNFLTREFSPWIAIDPSKRTDRLGKIPQPAATVHTLLMTETGEYAGADHVHVEGWGSATQAPIIASTQVHTAAAGGLAKSADARSDYGFVDGHVATHRFSEVYINQTANRFDPFSSPIFDRLVEAGQGNGS